MPSSVDRALLALLQAEGESAETLVLMRRIDELFLKYPFTAPVGWRFTCAARACASADAGPGV